MAHALRSTLVALPFDSEIAVFNDASEDRTVRVIEEISDPRVKVISSSLSLGSGTARQELLRATDSEFVANMDADDVCLPWRFAYARPLLRSSDLAFGSALRFGSTALFTKPLCLIPLRNSETALALLYHNPFVHSTMMARRTAIENAGGYRSIRRGQDYDLWLRIASIGLRIAKSSIPLVAYRVGDHQVSRQVGYINAIASDACLRASYLELWKSLVSSYSEPGMTVNPLSNCVDLADLAKRFSWRARRYYEMLATHQNVAVETWQGSLRFSQQQSM